MTAAVTGSEILPQALRSGRMGLGGVGRELGIATNALESFLAGGTRPLQQLNAIAALTFGSAVTFDEEHDLLRSSPQPESPASFIRPPRLEMNLPKPARHWPSKPMPTPPKKPR